MSLDDLDFHSQLHEKSKASVSVLSQIYVSVWVKFSMLSQPVGLLKLVLNLFCTSTIQGRELCWRDFMKCMIDLVLESGHLQTNLFQTWCDARHNCVLQLVPVWMTLMFTQGHGKARTRAVILLWSGMKQLKFSGWVIMKGRWLWISPVWRIWIVWAFALPVFCYCWYFVCLFCVCVCVCFGGWGRACLFVCVFVCHNLLTNEFMPLIALSQRGKWECASAQGPHSQWTASSWSTFWRKRFIDKRYVQERMCVHCKKCFALHC